MIWIQTKINQVEKTGDKKVIVYWKLNSDYVTRDAPSERGYGVGTDSKVLCFFIRDCFNDVICKLKVWYCVTVNKSFVTV